MLTYISRRTIQTVPVVIGVTVLIFILMFVLPGEPARILITKGATPQALKNIEEKYGLDKPWYIQYGKYLSRLSQGDFGESIRYQRPVVDIIKEHYPNSFRLALVAIIIEVIFGLAAGIISAVNRRSFWNTIITLSTTILVAMPVFWLALLLQTFFGLKLHLLPLATMGDGSFRYYVLPALTLASVSTAYVARLMRTSLWEVLNQDYIRTAQAKGLPPRKIIFKHALKNGLIPVVTFVGLDFGALIGSAILTETVFSWPGIGRVIYLAILARDVPLVAGATLILVLVFVFLNLVVDISYAYLDPRIRYQRRA